MNNKPLIFDIGANKGNFSEKYSEKANVIAIEANPNLYKNLIERFINKNVIIENYAVSNDINEIDFYICPDDQMSSCNKNWLTTLRYKDAGIRETIKVKTITIDKLIEKYGIPFHIKVDVEGYEYEVIKGLTKKVKSIQFEYIKENYQDLTIPAIIQLIEIGYSKFKIKEEDGDFDPFFEYENFLNKEEIINKGMQLSKLSGMVCAFE